MWNNELSWVSSLELGFRCLGYPRSRRKVANMHQQPFNNTLFSIWFAFLCKNWNCLLPFSWGFIIAFGFCSSALKTYDNRTHNRFLFFISWMFLSVFYGWSILSDWLGGHELRSLCWGDNWVNRRIVSNGGQMSVRCTESSSSKYHKSKEGSSFMLSDLYYFFMWLVSFDARHLKIG